MRGSWACVAAEPGILPVLERRETMDERVQRVTEMEARLNRIAAWLREHTAPSDAIREDARLLAEYYDGPLWRADFETDEAGGFPSGLPRGVLSEDGIYNALAEYGERIRETAFAEAVLAIRPGRYRHFKGNEYEVIGVARNSEDDSPMVVYRALYGDGGLWCRPAAMWNETVERDGTAYRRFERID